MFHKAILMGMYAFADTVVISSGNKNIGFEFARTFGFEGDDPRKLLEFLRKIPAMDLAKRNRKFRNTDEVILFNITEFIIIIHREVIHNYIILYSLIESGSCLSNHYFPSNPRLWRESRHTQTVEETNQFHHENTHHVRFMRKRSHNGIYK